MIKEKKKVKADAVNTDTEQVPRCPECGVKLPERAVACPGCGYDLISGRSMRPRQERQDAAGKSGGIKLIGLGSLFAVIGLCILLFVLLGVPLPELDLVIRALIVLTVLIFFGIALAFALAGMKRIGGPADK